jgi:DNA repair protein RadC
MPEKRPTYGGLGAATTQCRRVPRGRGMEVCVTRPDKPGPQVFGSDDVCKVLRPVARRLPRESFYTLALNMRNEVIGIEEVHRGTVGGVDVHPRDVFQGALLANAASVIIAHNHPSGDPDASDDDFDLTRRLAKSARLLGVPLLDHVILGADECVSVRESRPRLFRDKDEDFD